MSFKDLNNITYRENNIVDESYLDDLTDASNIQNTNLKFCNSCGYQVYQVNYKDPDTFKCSNCGRVFSRVEKKNLIVRERMAPISSNKILDSFDDSKSAESFDAYTPLEQQKNKEKTNEIINSLVGNTDASVTLTKKRQFDSDEELLISKGLTIIDVE